MQIDYQLLRSVHAKLSLVADLNDQLERCPRMVRAAEASEKKLLGEWDAAKAHLLVLRKAADDKQLQLSTRESRIEKMKGQRNAAENNREYQLLGEQIEADLQANAVLSDEILELLEKIDAQVAAVALARSNHEKGVAESARVRGEAAGREARIGDDLAHANKELAALETRLPGEISMEYRRLSRQLGPGALAETDSEVCGSCHSVITTQTRSDLFARKPVFCKNCGTLLYLSADRVAR